MRNQLATFLGAFAFVVAACSRSSPTRSGDAGIPPPGEDGGVGTWIISGPPRPIAGEWRLQGKQLPFPRGRISNAIELLFSWDKSTWPESGQFVEVLVTLADGYHGPGTYRCGIDPARPRETCGVAVHHYADVNAAPSTWSHAFGSRPRIDCTFTVAQDDDAGFNGNLACTGLSRVRALASKDGAAAAGGDRPIDLSGTWSFGKRKIFTLARK